MAAPARRAGRPAWTATVSADHAASSGTATPSTGSEATDQPPPSVARNDTWSAPPSSRSSSLEPAITYFVAACIAGKKCISWSFTPSGVVQAILVAASGPILIVDTSLVYGPLESLQPPEPGAVPASAKIAVTVVPATMLVTGALPLLTPAATQRVFDNPAGCVAENVRPTLPSAVLSSSLSPVTA